MTDKPHDVYKKWNGNRPCGTETPPAPERIWADVPCQVFSNKQPAQDVEKVYGKTVEYVRADLSGKLLVSDVMDAKTILGAGDLERQRDELKAQVERLERENEIIRDTKARLYAAEEIERLEQLFVTQMTEAGKNIRRERARIGSLLPAILREAASPWLPPRQYIDNIVKVFRKAVDDE